MRDIFFLFYLVKSHLKRQFWILNCLFNLHLSTASIQVFAYTSLNTFHVYDYATANGIYEKECSVQRSVLYFERIFTNCCLIFIRRPLMSYEISFYSYLWTARPVVKVIIVTFFNKKCRSASFTWFYVKWKLRF